MAAEATHPVAPPVLSTPETHIFEDPTPAVDISSREKLSDEELLSQYEIVRTVEEIRIGGWRRIALQFEDSMLPDAVRVYEALKTRLSNSSTTQVNAAIQQPDLLDQSTKDESRLFILGDTSYGACCVDEIAAEHVDAQVVVHYGRSCLSPTARLPVIYVFTTKRLRIDDAVATFKETYRDLNQEILLISDVPYYSHQAKLLQALRDDGYNNIFSTEMIHNPSSPLPNRTVPDEARQDISKLKEYQVFHIGQPPMALLLTLSSRVRAIHIYSGALLAKQNRSRALAASSTMALKKRYALITSLSTVSIFGILINTLSVRNYLDMVERVKEQITAAGKKYYTFVVGKVNAAKIANFSEVGGWVVIGCWESSLVESSEFFKPLITPYELQLALQADDARVWTGEWTSDFEAVLRQTYEPAPAAIDEAEPSTHWLGAYDSEEESAAPEFDLRTGRYVSHSRPMAMANRQKAGHKAQDQSTRGDVQAARDTSSLVVRPKGEIAQVGGVASPGAEFLRSQRTWQGLGSELATDFSGTGSDGAVMEEGRSGVARGYTVGDEGIRR